MSGFRLQRNGWQAVSAGRQERQPGGDGLKETAVWHVVRDHARKAGIERLARTTESRANCIRIADRAAVGRQLNPANVRMRLQWQIQPAGKRLESRVAAQTVEDGFGHLLDAHGALFVRLCEPYDRGVAVAKSRVDYCQVDRRKFLCIA